jgi:hypothetical protein
MTTSRKLSCVIMNVRNFLHFVLRFYESADCTARRKVQQFQHAARPILKSEVVHYIGIQTSKRKHILSYAKPFVVEANNAAMNATNFSVAVRYVRPPLWSGGQSSWLQIKRCGFDSRHFQIFWELVGLKRGPLSLMSTTEEQLGWKNSGSDLENWEYGRMDPSRSPHGNLFLQIWH